MNDQPPVVLRSVPCPICGAKDHRTIVESVDNQWGIEGTFRVAECLQCGHRFMNPQPTPATLSACYPDNYGPHQNTPSNGIAKDALSRGGDQQATPWYLRYLPLRYVPGLKSLFRWLTDDRSQVFPKAECSNGMTPRAFELGCAAGAYLSKLRESGWDVRGVEPGAGPVETARSYGLQVECGTLETMPQPETHYDFAASWMVLEHVPDPVSTLRQLFELLKPGGQLAISVPNAGCWEPRFYGPAWDAWDLPRHLHHFSPRSIRQLLQRQGFVNIRIIHQRSLLNIIGSQGIVMTRRNSGSRLGNWLLEYPHSPRLWLQLLLAPLAHLLAFVKQSGRLTITAERPREMPEQNESK